MRSRLLAVTFEADNPAGPARFWAGLLGREVIEDAGGVLLPGGDAQLGLRFVPGRAGQLGANRMHLHLTSADLDDQRHTVATAVRLGGRHVDVGQRPEEGHVVLADPAGYEFCVIEPGNGYLAGCGPLGELTCAGTRQVGLFWSRALGWPLVWDRGEQTAIQSPRGGTKLAWDAWDGTRRQVHCRRRAPTPALPGTRTSRRLPPPPEGKVKPERVDGGRGTRCVRSWPPGTNRPALRRGW